MSYDAQEAARLISWSNRQAGIGPLTEAELTQWIDDGVGLLEWEDVWEEDGVVEKYIDFHTLISLRMICLLSSQVVPLKIITEAMPQLREGLSVKCPYASKSLWNLTEVPDSLARKEEVRIIINGIFLCSEEITPHKLEFGADGMACAWIPIAGIRIDPLFVSGSPCLAGTRIPTWVFPGMHEGGDSIKELAEDYCITVERVEQAMEWERQLASAWG